MKTTDAWKQEHDRLMGLLDEARAELQKYPGVAAVEIGIKESQGDLTDDLAFRVYVTKKLPEDQLAPGEVIPDEIFGVKTDVIEYDSPAITFNTDKFRPLKGGIQIDNEEPAGQGTLGCIAKVNGSGEVVVLTNAHVVQTGGATGSVDMGQPEYTTCCCCACDDIGHSAESDRAHNGSVDAAIVHLKSGIGADNVIRMLNADNTDGVVQGSANAAVSSDAVVKVGRTSDKTFGTVVSITHPTSGDTDTPARTNQILIRPNTGVTLFQDFGDSGSALVDKDNKVIGVMWGAYLTPGTALYGHGIACPIAAVMSALNINIPAGGLTTAGPTLRSASSVRVIVPEQPEASELVALLEQRLSQTEQGRAVLRLLATHRKEIVTLINHNRAVTVTWHRKQGPAFLAALGRSAKHPEYRIPAEIEGITRQHLFMSMATVLEEHGSDELRAAVRRHALPLLGLIDRYDSVREMADALETHILPELAGVPNAG